MCSIAVSNESIMRRNSSTVIRGFCSHASMSNLVRASSYTVFRNCDGSFLIESMVRTRTDAKSVGQFRHRAVYLFVREISGVGSLKGQSVYPEQEG
jgi:hypothetical protein